MWFVSCQIIEQKKEGDYHLNHVLTCPKQPQDSEWKDTAPYSEFSTLTKSELVEKILEKSLFPKDLVVKCNNGPRGLSYILGTYKKVEGRHRGWALIADPTYSKQHLEDMLMGAPP